MDTNDTNVRVDTGTGDLNKEEVKRYRLQQPLPDAAWDPSMQTNDADDEPRWTDLQLASRSGDLQRVIAILSEHQDKEGKYEIVNAPPVGYYGQTALQAACMSGHEDIVQVLLAARADIHAAGGNNTYRNAFEFACGTGNISIFYMLLDAGAIVNPVRVTRYQGRTPVQAAAEGGHQDIVKLLLDHGANIDAPASASSGVTALQAATMRQHLSIVELLLSRGADVNAPAGKNNGCTALQAACLSGNMEIVHLLLQNAADINAPGSVLHGGTALHAAVAGGHVDVVRRLLAAGANPNSLAGRANQTPLQSAYLIGREDITDLLRKAGANGPVTGGRILFTNAKRMENWSSQDYNREARIEL